MNLLLTLLFLLTGCNISTITSGGSSSSSTRSGNTNESDFNGEVKIGQGLVLKDNPIILTGDESVADGIDLNPYRSTRDITLNPRLDESCFSKDRVFKIQNCFKVFKDKVTPALTPTNGKWDFDGNSQEFLQVHTFYHTKKSINRFFDALHLSYTTSNPLGILGGGSYESAIPPTLYSSGAFWYDFPLVVYSNCDSGEGVAFYDPSNHSICFGQDNRFSNFILSQDPSVIYHEVAHGLVKTGTNIRNRAEGTLLLERTDLGHYSYDEAGAINEGIADYYSFVNNERTHFAEWALGRFYRASRPIAESDEQHAIGISTDADSRLSYPKFINYDSNEPVKPFEDIHLPGQILSHFLAALHAQIVSKCSVSNNVGFDHINFLLIETMAHLGDLTSLGTSNPLDNLIKNNVNLIKFNNNGELVSKLWSERVRPINFYTFFQTFGRYFYRIFDNGGAPKVSCPGLTIDSFESLLDQYGLLIFTTYNDNGQDETYGHSGTLTRVVNPRARSVLIAKDLLKLPNIEGKSDFFVFDNQSQLSATISNLKAAGIITNLSPQIESSLPFNNGDGQVSRGEIVGIAPNFYNNSNFPMGGVQVLSNDWDHTRKEDDGFHRACSLDDDKILESEGAATPSTSPTIGDCEYITRTNGHDTDGTNTEEVFPICLMQFDGENQTEWLTQDRFREEATVEPDNCLMGSTSTKDCFIRAIPGGDVAFYSQIKPKKTWGETITGDGSSPVFEASNIVYFEISEWIPPGTKIKCRFRARFTNCKDCWTDTSRSDLDDYLDYEYSGERPYKLIPIEFTILE